MLHLLLNLQDQDIGKNLFEESKKNPVISLNESSFNDYVQTQDKGYSFVVLFTGADRLIYERYFEIAKMSAEGPEFTSKLFFGMVDTVKEPTLFESVKVCYLRDTGKLITNESPILLHYPPFGNPTLLDYVDFKDIQVDDVHDKIFTLIETRCIPPPVTLDTVIEHPRRIFKYLYDTRYWACFITGYCIMAVAGDSWNRIWSPPLVHFIDEENINIINKKRKEQFILEYCIVIILISAFVSNMIRVIDCLSRVKRNESKATRVSNIRLGMFFICISFTALNGLFKYKES